MFWALINFSLRRRLFVLFSCLVLVGFGTFVLRDIPVDLLPDIHRPMVIVISECGGLAPEEVEQLVTHPIEIMMTGMPGVRKVRSTVSPGFSITFVEFDWGGDILRNRQFVAERLAMAAPQLPPRVTPILAPMSGVTGLMMQIALTSTSVSPMELREIADWVVRPRLMGIAGVSQIYRVGGEVKQFQFTPDLAAMRRLDISLDRVASALDSFGTNTSGGFADLFDQEFIIRNVGRTNSLDDLRNIVVDFRDGYPVVLSQIGEIGFTPRVKRGDGSFNGKPAVLMVVVKHPSANTVRLAETVQDTLAEIEKTLPHGIKLNQIAYNQATLIKDSIANVQDVLVDAIIIVAIVLLAFLMNVRTTLISLTAIPISLLATVICFKLIGLTVNTMTLGGIAIAIGQLVDDAVVDVENILRRLSENRKLAEPKPILHVIALASQEVRSGILYATVIVLLVFVPLFALPDQEGRLFAPLGIAYILSILASLITSITITPVLCSYMLPSMKTLEIGHGGRMVGLLKRWNERSLAWALDRPGLVIGGACALVLAAAISLFGLPRSFLPPFNEGNLYVTLLNRPGISLAESSRVGALAEHLLMQVPEVTSVARRVGRNEADEDGDPILENDLSVNLKLKDRSRAEVFEDARRRLAVLPAEYTISQFLTARMELFDQGVRGAVVLKIFGDDLDTLRSLAGELKGKFAAIPGLVDLGTEQINLVPQIRIRIDYERAKLFGVTPAAIAKTLESLSIGRVVSQIIDNGRRFDVIIRLSDADRTSESLADMRVETPVGRVTLSSFAHVDLTRGPNQIPLENGRRRIAIMANTDGSDMARIVSDMRAVIAATPVPTGYFTSLEGSFQQQERAQKVMAGLATVSLSLVFLVLRGRYLSSRLALIIMANVPLALIGSVACLWLWGQDLSLASMIGFITVTGVSVRNGVLKISHFINLALSEGEVFGRQLIVRGCQERLTPVLMTALSAGLALIPLLFLSDRPGTEILHPVAVAIFGGLISSTLLDTLTTPLLFAKYGAEPLARLLKQREMTTSAQLF